MNEKIKKYLLSVARSTIAVKLGLEEPELKIPPGALTRVLQEKRGVFVTLEIGGRLRGCIGHIEGILPLILGVRENAESAAFGDPRFDPLTASEFPNVDVEISVLSVPRPLSYSDAEDLKAKLRVGVDGVVLSKGFAKATYLPQVWDTFREEMGAGAGAAGAWTADDEDALKEQFLGSLCAKAGLPYDEWREGDVKVETYQAEVIGE